MDNISIPRMLRTTMDERVDVNLDENEAPPGLTPSADNHPNMEMHYIGVEPSPRLGGGTEGRRQISTITDTGSTSTLCIKKRVVSREVFYAQAILIYIICLACILNLSLGTEYSHVWISLLSGSAAYLLPAPKVKGSRKNTIVGLPKEATTSPK